MWKLSGSTALYFSLLAFVISPALATPAFAQSQQHIDWCTNTAHEFSPDQQVIGCTAAIESHKWNGQSLAWAFNNRGFAYYLKGDLDRALADFEQSIQLDPKNAVAFNNRGLIYQSKDELDRAIADYNEAIRLDPTYIFAFNNRGGAYADKNDYDHAIADYNEAIRLDPTFAVALKARGNAYFAKRDLDHAFADYEQLIKLNPNFAGGFYNRGLIYQLRGELDRAIADYTEAIRLDPKNALAFNNRGNVYQLQGEPARAIPDYSESIRLDPGHAGMYLNRGLAELFTGNLSLATADLNRASELNPRSAYAALWREIVDKRRNLPGGLAQSKSQIDMARWPAPIISLYLGQLTKDAVLAAADNPDATTKRSQICEANFFTGELELQRGSKDQAVHLLRVAAAECGKNTHVRAYAIAELKSIGVQP